LSHDSRFAGIVWTTGFNLSETLISVHNLIEKRHGKERSESAVSTRRKTDQLTQARRQSIVNLLGCDEY
jgi:hypothetical protein